MSEVSPSSNDKEIVKVEVRYAVHIPASDHNKDTHYVKEVVTFKDKTQAPRTRLIEDYMRPAWAVQENKRNFREYKEFEELTNLTMKMTTDSDLNRTYAMLIDQPHLANRRDLVRQSPYVFGYDVTAASFIKLESLQRNDFIQSEYSVCALDLETTVDTKQILMGSIAMVRNGKIHIRAGYVKEWLSDHVDPVKKIREKMDQLLPDYKGKIHLEVIEHKDDLSVIRDLFRKANKWQPDWMSIWNLSFDIGEVILPTCHRHKINPIDVLCDPRLPRHLRKFDYTPGRTQRVTASGKVFPIPFDEQWQKIDSTTTFMIMDSMRGYRALRIPFGRDPSYALDAILAKEEVDQKLKVEGADIYLGVTWHIHMQANMKIEYCIYNFVDNIRLLELDADIGDLSLSIPVFAGITSFNDFASSSVKNYNNLFIYGLGKGRVVGVGINPDRTYANYLKDHSQEGTDVYKYDVMSLDDWIETLPQGNFLRNGLKLFRDYPNLITDARGNAVDEDSVSSYPSCIMAMNVSKETTYTEVQSIEGLTNEEIKSYVLGCIIGNANSIEFCNEIFNITTLEEIADDILSGRIALVAANEDKVEEAA